MFPDPLYFSVSAFAQILSLSCCYVAHFIAVLGWWITSEKPDSAGLLSFPSLL